MAEIVNLRRRRKRKAREEKRGSAAAQRRAHGEAGADKRATSLDQARATRAHEGHRLEGEDEADGEP